ncbi:AI-2E family transporter [uncultured Aureimonas sp.]|uniref:AI-2E family transporter n=1 Tax=uncultured Aureimonas sp. TaxID=1604662 RepID=UPI0025D52497|nr:AI-2E family transporter [uncultured Aureimonas sp.]
MDIVTSQMLRRALPLFTALAIGVLTLSIAAILTLGREIFVPFALGILLAFILAPIVIGLQRRRVPRMLAISGAILAATVAIVALGFIIALQITSLVGEIPSYRLTVQQKLQSLSASAQASGNGPFSRAAVALEEMAADIQHLAAPAETAAGNGADGAPAPRPIPVTVENESSLFDTISAIALPLLQPLATFGVVIIFAIFILLQREDLRNRFIRLAGTDDLQQTTAAIDDAARRLSKLLLFQLGVNAAFGVVTALGLWLLGVPSPALWGILGGILRFIPYVGGFVGAGLPMLLAFAVDPGWSMVIWTAVLYLGAETILSNVVEPVLYGHSTGLSPVAILLAATIWAFLWGPVGLILATPLTICLVVMGRHVPRLAFIDVMFGDRPALSPPQIFYQRMLAGAPDEAIDQAHDFLRQRELATYYDEVALEGLRIAHEDVARFAVEGERLETLQRSTLELVEGLKSVRTSALGGRRSKKAMSAEAAAAVDAAGPDQEVTRIVQRQQDLAPAWRGDRPVVCLSGSNALDGAVTAMLAQVLTRHGLRAEAVSLASLIQNPPSREDAKGVALVCLSFVEPLSTVHLRQAVRRVHRFAPRARILIGIWRQRDPTMLQELKRRVHADALVTTLNGALAAALDMSGQAMHVPAPETPAAPNVTDETKVEAAVEAV